MSIEELRPIRLEIAISLLTSTHPEAKQILAGIIELDPVIGKIIQMYLGANCHD